MLKQKFVFAVSLIAMVTVGVGSARADIASTVYVQQGVNSAKTAASAAQTSANNANTAAVNAQTSADEAQEAAEAAQASADSAAASAKTANDAIADLNLTQVGADGSYIKTVKQADGKVTATAEAADTTPTANSKKMVTSGGVYTALSGKQATLTTSNIKGAGSVSVGISNGVITVTGTDNDTKYTLPAATSSALGGVKIGSNITNSGGTISVPAASSSAFGVVKTGTNITNSSGTISVTTTAIPTKDSGVPLTSGGAYTALAAKEATANKLTTDATTTISETNQDTLYPTIGRVMKEIDDTVTEVNNNISALNSGLTSLQTTVNGKQAKLTTSNVTTTGNGNVVTAVTAADGKVTVTKGTSLGSLATKSAIATGDITDGTVATVDIADGAVTAAKTSGVIGYIPSGSATSTTYATIWVE